jgi:hypothetical protein
MRQEIPQVLSLIVDQARDWKKVFVWAPGAVGGRISQAWTARDRNKKEEATWFAACRAK